MIVNVFYWIAVACAGLVAFRNLRDKLGFGQKFGALTDDLSACPDFTYAELWKYAPNIRLCADNFDKPVRFLLAVPSAGMNRREVFKLFYLAEYLKKKGLAYECVYSAAPELRARARLVFERNKYRFHTFPEKAPLIRWRYPRFPELSKNEELSVALRRIRRCILNYYHKNKYSDDPFYKILFDFFRLEPEAFLQTFREILRNSFDRIYREKSGVIFPMTEDEEGIFFACSIYHLSAMHLDLSALSGERIETVRTGRVREVSARREDCLEQIFFPLLSGYFARTEPGELASFNLLCARGLRMSGGRTFGEYFGENAGFFQPVTEEGLLFLLRFSKLRTKEGTAELCNRASLLRHNLPETSDFFSACELYLVLLSKILKVNFRGDRLYFAPSAELLPLSADFYGKRIEFLPAETLCANNSIPLRSDRTEFTVYVN